MRSGQDPHKEAAVSFTFERVEKKYRMSKLQFEQLYRRIGGRLIPDEFGRSTILSLYIDTPNHRLVRASIDAKEESKAYKEKLRLRSYGTPSADSTVYLELKKKYRGVVYKRREDMTLAEAETYFRTGICPKESQIMKEIDYAMKLYGRPQPAMMIAYDREAFTVEGHPELRITFDRNVRYRETELKLSKGSAGTALTCPGEVLMEVKTDHTIPLWLSQALNECRIYPTSFSKYGSAYEICEGQRIRESRKIRQPEAIRVEDRKHRSLAAGVLAGSHTAAAV